MKTKPENLKIKWACGIFAFLFLANNTACTLWGDSDPEDEISKAAQSKTEVIDQTIWYLNRYPWPAGKFILHKTLDEESIKAAGIRFQLWDFNSDGRPDMVQEFDANEKLIRTAFDFDLDGNIDAIFDPNPKTKPPLQNSEP